MEETPELVIVNGRKAWRFGDRLLPFVAGGDGEGSNGGGGQQGQGQPPSNGGSGQQGQPQGGGTGGAGAQGSVMEPEGGQPAGGQGSGDQGGQAGDGQQGTQRGDDLQRIVQDAARAGAQEAAAQFDSMFDRRINQRLVDRMTVQPQQGSPGSGPSQGGQGDGGNGAVQPGQSQPAPTVDVRDATRIARDYLDDYIPDGRWLGADEKAHWRGFTAALVQGQAQRATAGDEEELGRRVGEQVAKEIRTIRQFYESRSVEGLRKRGALKETPGQPPASGGTGGDAASQFGQGQADAKRLYGDRVKAS